MEVVNPMGSTCGAYCMGSGCPTNCGCASQYVLNAEYANAFYGIYSWIYAYMP
jgi:hypothetical protein